MYVCARESGWEMLIIRFDCLSVICDFTSVGIFHKIFACLQTHLLTPLSFAFLHLSKPPSFPCILRPISPSLRISPLLTPRSSSIISRLNARGRAGSFEGKAGERAGKRREARSRRGGTRRPEAAEGAGGRRRRESKSGGLDWEDWEALIT